MLESPTNALVVGRLRASAKPGSTLLYCSSLKTALRAGSNVYLKNSLGKDISLQVSRDTPIGSTKIPVLKVTEEISDGAIVHGDPYEIRADVEDPVAVDITDLEQAIFKAQENAAEIQLILDSIQGDIGELPIVPSPPTSVVFSQNNGYGQVSFTPSAHSDYYLIYVGKTLVANVGQSPVEFDLMEPGDHVLTLFAVNDGRLSQPVAHNITILPLAEPAVTVLENARGFSIYIVEPVDVRYNGVIVEVKAAADESLLTNATWNIIFEGFGNYTEFTPIYSQRNYIHMFRVSNRSKIYLS